ncbi:Cytochrome c biogenesis protein CcsA [Candidatus Xiphinematobacter sp. Idaho Grape]|uniref:cytochrome c biogenesis protein n=1 Tax=Candidatus Xiphinematobacter sp. Idaho Grape TaxID=1704307 RepID=UPI00070693DD|nr:cytochrome c biogenesis protein CcsA [Candidatus Xiphinematobacter sp. Idaho Grape]ALJ56836.1 Cytochrome c biogenesis protein CcsA [Candidatus Xiphinematobacter sp. Idaho Grape]
MTVRFFLFLVNLWIGVPLSCYADLHALNLPPSLESLPIQNQGRKKPFLAFANEFLLSVAGASSLTLGHTSLPAVQIVVALWLSPEGWEQIHILLVGDKSLKKACRLTENQGLFSFETLRDNRTLQSQIEKARAARIRNPSVKLPAALRAAEEVATRMSLLVDLASGSLVRIVPNPSDNSAPWSALSPLDPCLEYLRSTYTSGNVAAFETAVTALKTSLAKGAPACYAKGMFKIRLELLYQTIRPFRSAWILYLLGGLVLLFSNSYPSTLSYLCARVLTVAGLLFQLFGFICRILIAGRPPVANMYESVVWFAFGTILFALLFEQVYRTHFFLAGAIPVSSAALFLADRQPLILTHSIQPLTAVLQSNFWLTTHVLITTLSYAAFALAMGMSHIALWKVFFRQPISDSLYEYIYRVLQIGTFLLTGGIFLGGIWANYSWGRFWDWDPKETWALVTLLTYLVLLHGRIAHQWDALGLAIGAIVCFLSVLMAWYGVNFVLGTGLHSYGFGVGGRAYVASAVGLDALFVISAVVRGQYFHVSRGH